MGLVSGQEYYFTTMVKDGRKYICIDCGSVDSSLEEAMKIIQANGLKIVEDADWLLKRKEVVGMQKLMTSWNSGGSFFLFVRPAVHHRRGRNFLSRGNLHNFRLELLCNLTKDFFLKSLDFLLCLWYIIIRKRETETPRKKGKKKSWKKRKWFWSRTDTTINLSA